MNRPGFDGGSLVLFSGCLVGGLERSVMSGFELGWGHVTEVAVKAFGVVPVHPAERRELDVLDGLPRSVTHNWLGAVAVKSRFTRSAGLGAVGSDLVVRNRRRRHTPSMPAWLINRAT